MTGHHLASPLASLAAVLLAAGSSRRYGAANKLLAEIDRVPLVRRVADVLMTSGFQQVVIVTGHQAEAIQLALQNVPSRNRQFVHNSAFDDGMGRSIATGVAALPATVTGVLIAQGDMPDLTVDLIARLGQRFAATGSAHITAPWIVDERGGRQGNPVIWPRRLFGQLAALTGDQGGRELIKAEGDAVERVPVGGSAAAVDIDTPAQLAAYLKRRAGADKAG
jgi:molybdenum cofactor cytidylyltransferase